MQEGAPLHVMWENLSPEVTYSHSRWPPLHLTRSGNERSGGPWDLVGAREGRGETGKSGKVLVGSVGFCWVGLSGACRDGPWWAEIRRYIRPSRSQREISVCQRMEMVNWWWDGSFSFLYLKKIKISKIYGRFENFQNYTPVAPCLGDRGPVAPWLGDRT